MTKVRIYQPDKTAMQSGKGKAKRWKLEYLPDTPYFVENLMGWNGMTDTNRQLDLYFPSKEAAVAYAEAKKLVFEVVDPHARKEIRKSYADNFKYLTPKQTHHP